MQLKIGTRESALALAQTQLITDLLAAKNVSATVVNIKSEGDINLVQPLYEMGIQGIFTKSLDEALLNHKVDLAVHSLKDVPTMLPKGLVICAIPLRANPFDVMLSRDKISLEKIAAGEINATIATSSLRRKAQWLHKYPTHKTENIRGNVQSRIEKLEKNTTWGGVIFAKAGLDRLGINYPNAIVLDWIVPAPAQGAIAVVCRAEDGYLLEIMGQFTDANTQNCVNAERQFLSTLHGGCSVPIGCYAEIKDNKMTIEGCILTEDGSKKMGLKRIFNENEYDVAGKIMAENLLANGAEKIIETFRKAL